jgi:hypothetical protein
VQALAPRVGCRRLQTVLAAGAFRVAAFGAQGSTTAKQVANEGNATAQQVQRASNERRGQCASKAEQRRLTGAALRRRGRAVVGKGGAGVPLAAGAY